MFAEKRPTAVSVIGWAWIVLGGLMLLSAGSALVLTSFYGGFSFPFALNTYRLFSVLELVVGSCGLVAGVSFLKLRLWSRIALETLSWLAIAGILASSVGLMFSVPGLPALFIGVAIGMSLLYCVPLGLMLRALRSDKVRDALSASA